MKSSIHPEYIATKVKCNGCGNAFDTHSTISEITVEICSNCHPFYTGKQKLVDTAGRVDKFNARQAKAAKLQAASNQTKPTSKDPVLEKIEDEFEGKTVALDEPTSDPSKNSTPDDQQ
jgi:large subunit ribosomal protein L31